MTKQVTLLLISLLGALFPLCAIGGATNAVHLIKKIESELPPGARYAGSIQAQNQRVLDDVAKWQREVDAGTATEGVFLGRGSFGGIFLESVKKALGEADRESSQELTPATKQKDIGFAIREENTGEIKLIAPWKTENKRYMVGHVLWYGPYGLGFLTNSFSGLENLCVLLHSNAFTKTSTPNDKIVHPPSAERTTAGRSAARNTAEWPTFDGQLSGDNELRVRNPNDFRVKVGLRSSGKGKDFSVDANASQSVRVPNGRYEIFFQYSTDPNGLYQGDSFTLKDNGVEIQIVKVRAGNYNIRKVR